jgi:hypothetical protein
MLSFTFIDYYAECHNADCRYDECFFNYRSAEKTLAVMILTLGQY